VPLRGEGACRLASADMATLLRFCEDVPEMVLDLDHIMTLAIGKWHERNGCNISQLVNEEADISVKVGMDDPLPSGPPIHGGAGTPPLARLTSKPMRKSVRNAYGGQTDMEILNATGRYKRLVLFEHTGSESTSEMLSREKNLVRDFTMSDFVLAECPTLLKMYRESRGSKALGPLRRSSRLFEAVVALCKLRWLVRLHYALISFAGPQCSLRRILAGAVADMCSPRRFGVHSTLMLYELAVQTLHHRFQGAWPIFVRYVGSIDPAKFEGIRPGSARTARSEQITTHQFSTPRGKVKQNEYSLDDVSVSQIVDDIFVISCVQDDPF